MATLTSLPINISALGTHTVVAGNVGTPTIQVVGLFFQCSVGTNLTVKSGTTALTGPMSFTGGGGLNLPSNGTVYFECDSATDLVFDLTGLTGQVGGLIMYYQF